MWTLSNSITLPQAVPSTTRVFTTPGDNVTQQVDAGNQRVKACSRPNVDHQQTDNQLEYTRSVIVEGLDMTFLRENYR